MVLGLKIKLREIVIRVLLTIARWIVEHLDDEGDALPPVEGGDGTSSTVH